MSQLKTLLDYVNLQFDGTGDRLRGITITGTRESAFAVVTVLDAEDVIKVWRVSLDENGNGFVMPFFGEPSR